MKREKVIAGIYNQMFAPLRLSINQLKDRSCYRVRRGSEESVLHLMLTTMVGCKLIASLVQSLVNQTCYSLLYLRRQTLQNVDTLQ